MSIDKQTMRYFVRLDEKVGRSKGINFQISVTVFLKKKKKKAKTGYLYY